MTFTQPGRIYLQKHSTIESMDDILAYAEFLRVESGLDETVPVNLKAIFEHFDIPEPQKAPLPNLQGLLVDADHGFIMINSNDSDHRQKFTKAHELVEFLFCELPQSNSVWGGKSRIGGFRQNTKEYLCNWTAANLLMPPTYVRFQIQKYGVNFDCARILAVDCDVSLSAALIQLARLSSGRHVVVLWRMKNKPSELKNRIPEGQLLFEGIGLVDRIPPKKLRVEWTFYRPNSLYMPKNKSVDQSSLIFKAWQNNLFTNGYESFVLNHRKVIRCHVENLPFEVNSERFVISLIEHLGG